MSWNAQDSPGDPSEAEGGSTQKRDIVGETILDSYCDITG